MMPMPKGSTAWEKEPRRQMRSFAIRVFMTGLMLGMGIGEIRFQHFHIVWRKCKYLRIVGGASAGVCCPQCLWPWPPGIIGASYRSHQVRPQGRTDPDASPLSPGS